jgi:hypothetical protein
MPGAPLSMGALKRAMMVPDDVQPKPGAREFPEREYPDPGVLLMPNPFPKPKKKKGKKGKK